MEKPIFLPVYPPGNQIQKTFFEKVCFVIIYNFVVLRHFAGMTQFREVWKKPVFHTCFDTW